MSAQKSLADDLERSDRNVNGLFAKVSDLVDRVDETIALRWGGRDDLETFRDHHRGEATPAAQRRERETVDWL